MIVRLPDLLTDLERYSRQMGCEHLAWKWGRQLELIARRVIDLVWLNAAGRELVMCAYVSGVMAGMYGESSAIAEGLRIAQRDSLRTYRRDFDDPIDVRRTIQFLEVLGRAGVRDGREIMRAREEALEASASRATMSRNVKKTNQRGDRGAESTATA